MKWAMVLAGVSALLATGVAIYVVLVNRDPVPNAISACVRKAQLPIARSSSALGLARADVSAGRLRTIRRWDFGHTDAALLSPRAGDYALLVLSNADATSVRSPALARRAYEEPGTFPLVAVETPVRGRLVACAHD